MTGILRLVMVGFDLLALVLLFIAASAWRNRRRLSSSVGFLAAVLCLTIGVLLAAITVGIRGYRSFTQEALAATVKTEPLGPHHFRATVTLADNSLHMFDLAGDAVYIDAHVLKWRPIGTLLGLETVYELDRIAGRYQAQQHAWVLTLSHVVVEPRGQRPRPVGRLAVPAQRDQVRRAVRRVATNGGGNGIPVQFPREANVAHHDVGAEGHRHRQSPVTVRGDLDVVAGNLQDAAETLGKVPIVFHDQDPVTPGARVRAGDRWWRLRLR